MTPWYGVDSLVRPSCAATEILQGCTWHGYECKHDARSVTGANCLWSPAQAPYPDEPLHALDFCWRYVVGVSLWVLVWPLPCSCLPVAGFVRARVSVVGCVFRVDSVRLHAGSSVCYALAAVFQHASAALQFHARYALRCMKDSSVVFIRRGGAPDGATVLCLLKLCGVSMRGWITVVCLCSLACKRCVAVVPCVLHMMEFSPVQSSRMLACLVR